MICVIIRKVVECPLLPFYFYRDVKIKPLKVTLGKFVFPIRMEVNKW